MVTYGYARYMWLQWAIYGYIGFQWVTLSYILCLQRITYAYTWLHMFTESNIYSHWLNIVRVGHIWLCRLHMVAQVYL